MKKLMMVLALGSVLGMVGMVSVASAKGAKGDKVHGKITALNPDAKNANATDIELTVGKKGAQQTVTIVADGSATVTIDGQPAKLADLKVGERAVISPSSGTPQTIQASTKAHGHKKKDAAAATDSK